MVLVKVRDYFLPYEGAASESHLYTLRALEFGFFRGLGATIAIKNWQNT